MPRGGRRTPREGKSLGRPKTKLATEVTKAIHDNTFAANVLGRIGELGLDGVKAAEDYALHLLKFGDARIKKEVFMDLYHSVHGRAPSAAQLAAMQKDERGGEGLKITVEYIGGEA
jgi:hypothetical protein